MKCPECQSINLLFLPSEHEDCCRMHTHYGTCLNCGVALEMHHTKDKDPEYAYVGNKAVWERIYWEV